MKMVVNNKFLLNTNLYGQMFIKKGKNRFNVLVNGNVFNKDDEKFRKVAHKYFSKPDVDILSEIDSKSDEEKLDTVISYFARSTKIKGISAVKPFLKFEGYDKCLSLKGEGYKDVLRKLVFKYSEDRMRFYGDVCDSNCFIIETYLDQTEYGMENNSVVFKLKEDIDNPRYGKVPGLQLIPIDEKFLSIFIREQVVNRDGEVSIEDGLLRIGDALFKYDDELKEVFRLALLRREDRIEREKRMQYKLDI